MRSCPLVPHLIDGKDVPGHGNATFDVYNPLTDEVLYQASDATLQDAQKAVESAAEAWKTWKTWGPSRRRNVLLKAADILEGKKAEAMDLLSNEVSAMPAWAAVNVMASAAILREVAGLATHIKGEVVPADRPGTMIMVTREPAGVVFSIAPWNAPINLSMRAVATPLICGNSVILKPSEHSVKSQRLVAEVFREAGLPDGVLNFLSMSPKQAPSLTEYIIQHKAVRRVTFTGSDSVGRYIAAYAARVLKPCVLELGGKAPLLVLEDANLDDAANAIVYGALFNSGQICMSTERIIVHKSVVSELCTRLTSRLSKIRAGNHLVDPSVQISGLFTKASAERAVQIVNEAVEKGAQLAVGDAKVKGTIMQPHLLLNVNNTMRVFVEETFAPIMAVITVSSDDEAIEVANDSDYSLTASVFSRDISRAMRVGRSLRSGSSHINGPTVYIEPTLPNGGTGGSSGYGRFGGIHGVDEFIDKRILTISDPGAVYPL